MGNPGTDVLRLLPAREGHFRLESGHHGHRWLDLETLCHDVSAVRSVARLLCVRLVAHEADVVCGPLIEGAFVALLVAEQLALPFTYAAPRPPSAEPLFPVLYRIPAGLRAKVAGRRVAVINDVIGAGSAVRGTLDHLRACGAQPVVIGTLATAGDSAVRLAKEYGVALETLAEMDARIWTPAECPLCARDVPLVDVAAAGGAKP